MAKITITLEDQIKDGEESVEVKCNSEPAYDPKGKPSVAQHMAYAIIQFIQAAENAGAEIKKYEKETEAAKEAHGN